MKPNIDAMRELAMKLSIRTPDVQLLLAQERFLARLLSHSEGRSFIWKGGSLVLRAYRNLSPPRFTVDLDFLIRGITIQDASSFMTKAALTELNDDFEFFDVTSSPMERETPYGGDRFEIRWKMYGRPGSQTLKIDICAGDFVESQEKALSEATFFCKEELSISIYPAEYIFAEKLETLARFGTGDTRTKDLIDLWSLRAHIPSPDRLKTALARCFERRGSNFSLPQLQAISQNVEFIRFHDDQLKRRFKTLQTPTMGEMLTEVFEFVNSAVQES